MVEFKFLGVHQRPGHILHGLCPGGLPGGQILHQSLLLVCRWEARNRTQIDIVEHLAIVLRQNAFRVRAARYLALELLGVQQIESLLQRDVAIAFLFVRRIPRSPAEQVEKTALRVPSEIWVARKLAGQLEYGSGMMLRNFSLVSVNCEMASSICSAPSRLTG